MRSGATIFLILMCAASWAAAHTITVRKDGSGDYSVIQDAVDASASGDTIKIGPGRFSEYTTHVASGINWYICMYLASGSLTVLGAGDNATFVGPAAPGTWGYDDYSVGALFFPAQPTDRFQISGVAFSDMRFGLYIQTGTCLAEDCDFQRNSKGVMSLGSSGVSRCTFANGTNVDIVVASPATNVLIRQCEFTRSYLPFNCQLIPTIMVEDCVMNQCDTAGIFDRCAGTMRRCNVAGSNWGLLVVGTGTMQILDNVIDGTNSNISFALGAGNVNCERNIFSGSTREAIYISDCAPRFRGNHILKGTGKAVRLVGFPQLPSRYVDMTGNYWGTASADSISAWIIDGSDPVTPPDLPIHGFAAFEPFSSVPTGTEKKSLGGVKALFR